MRSFLCVCGWKHDNVERSQVFDLPAVQTRNRRSPAMRHIEEVGLSQCEVRGPAARDLTLNQRFGVLRTIVVNRNANAPNSPWRSYIACISLMHE